MKEDMEKRQPKINDIKNTRANTAHSTEQINRVNDINKDRVSSTGMQSFQQGYNALGGNNFSRSNLNRKMPVSNSQSIGNVSNSRNKLKNQRNNNSNLKTGSSNKDPNSIPRALQNKNNNRILNRISRGISPSFDNNQEQQNEGNDVFEEDNELDISNNDVAVNKNVLVIVKMLPVLLPIAAIVILLIFVVALFSDPISVTSSFAGIETHDSSNPSYAYDESNPEGLAAEKEYNNKLFETIDFYRNNYNVNLDKYLLHAAVSYRYYGENIDDLYLSDSGVSKEDLENILLEKNLTNFDIEYTDYTRKIGVVAALMVHENNGSYISNSERYGIFYTNLMESEFLTSYYSEFLQNDSITSKQKLVDDIFDFYEYAKGLLTNNKNGGLVFDGMKVYLQTCAYDTSYNYKEINGLKVYDNPLTSEGTSYPSYLSMTDYVKGVLMGEIGDYIKEENKEGLKVMATVALSYIIRDDNSGFDLRSEELYFPTGNCRQVACDPNNGCTYIKGKTVGKYGTAFVGVGRFGNEGGQHYPLSESKQQILNEVLSDVFGNILVKKGVTSETFTGSRDMAAIQHYSDLEQDDCEAGRCFGQTNVLEDARNGMTYNEIIAKYLYNLDYDVINIKEGLYVNEADYATGNYDGNVIFYDQNDYKVNFCGRTDSTISRAGCGVTAAAIVASTLTGNSQYNPTYMNNLAKNGKHCGYNISGTNDTFFKDMATSLNFGYQKTESGTDVINALKTGNSLVIAHMDKGYFTDSGHYIVLSATNEDGKVYVHDPNNKMNKEYRNSGNGWYDINDIVDQLKVSFHIITKG